MNDCIVFIGENRPYKSQPLECQIFAGNHKPEVLQHTLWWGWIWKVAANDSEFPDGNNGSGKRQSNLLCYPESPFNASELSNTGFQK